MKESPIMRYPNIEFTRGDVERIFENEPHKELPDPDEYKDLNEYLSVVEDESSNEVLHEDCWTRFVPIEKLEDVILALKDEDAKIVLKQFKRRCI